jgi:hypothetical protein
LIEPSSEWLHRAAMDLGTLLVCTGGGIAIGIESPYILGGSATVSLSLSGSTLIESQ